MVSAPVVTLKFSFFARETDTVVNDETIKTQKGLGLFEFLVLCSVMYQFTPPTTLYVFIFCECLSVLINIPQVRQIAVSEEFHHVRGKRWQDRQFVFPTIQQMKRIRNLWDLPQPVLATS